MIVKILRKSATFKGVRYNTGKVEEDKGELMKVDNFGALMGLSDLRPQDYVNYLMAVSARSSRIKYPQFHAVISAKGRSHSKKELTDIAERWLKGMGYGRQPYMLVFHKDTKNNHLHIVTTRIGPDGKKIDDAFEKLKAYQVLNRVMAEDENLAAYTDIDKALAYNFSTRAQFMMILEAQGYTLKPDGSEYPVIKFGGELARLPLAKVDQRIAAYQKNKDRIGQLRAIIEKYRNKHDPAVRALTRPLPGGGTQVQTGYTSGLAEFLRNKFGVEVLFHSKDGKLPYGYTLIDHSEKQVFKGGEVMDLKAFIAPVHREPEEIENKEILTPHEPGPVTVDSNDISSHLSGSVTSCQDRRATEAEDPAAREDGIEARNDNPAEWYYHESTTNPSAWMDGFRLDIAEDVDDEAILGRNRHRKRKARNNTR